MLNFFKKKRNSVHNSATKSYQTDDGLEFPAVVLGLNIHCIKTYPKFMDEVIELFKNQRMCSPPETNHLTITIAGLIDSQTFVKDFRNYLKDDPILAQFISQMLMADVLQISNGKLLNKSSII